MTLPQRFLACETLIGIIAAAMPAGCASPQAQVAETDAGREVPPARVAETEAARETPPARARQIDAKAEPIFRQMCNTLDAAKTLRLRVRATMDRPVETGQLAEFHRTSEITVVRPDRLYAKTDSDDGEWTAWYRDKTLTVLDREDNTYATEAVPGRIDEMLDYLADNYDLVMPMADLLIGKTYDSLLADIDSGTYLGLHSVGATPCHHLLFRQENLDWQIWIDAGKQPLPRKLVITYTTQPDQPQYTATIDDWDLAPAVSAETFTFAPPAGAKSVPLSDLVAQK